MFYKNIKYLRKTNGLSQEDVAKVVGKEQGIVSLWERNERSPIIIDVIRLASYFHITIDSLLKEDLEIKTSIDNITTSTNDNVRIPVYDNLTNILGDNKDVVAWEVLSNSWFVGYREYFAIKISDSNMAPSYLKGDIVILEKDNTINSNTDCIVNVGNKSITLKKVVQQDNGIVLQSITDANETHFYTNEEVAKLPITIVGIAREIRRKI